MASSSSTQHQYQGGEAVRVEEEKGKEERWEKAPELTQEQVQMFEKENRDMIKHYQSTLSQVKYVLFTFYPYTISLPPIIYLFPLRSRTIANLSKQNSRILPPRNLRTPNTTSSEPNHPKRTHNPTPSRLGIHSHKRRRRKQGAQEG